MQVQQLIFAVIATLATGAAHANIVINPNFASPTQGGYNAVPNWTPIDSNPSRVYTGGGSYYEPYHNTGSAAFGQGFWDNGTAPNGVTSVGEIQVGGAPIARNTLTQTLDLVVGATYLLSYYENARGVTSSPSNLFTVEALVAGVDVIGPHNDFAVGGSNPFIRYTGSFVATAAQESLTFAANTYQNMDASVLLTAVDVTQVPEPSSIIILASAAGAFGYLHRAARSRLKPSRAASA